MLQINYDFETLGEENKDAWLDPYELTMLFEETRQTIDADLQRKLAEIRCDEHDEAPRITITARYDHEQEEMDLQYHIDTCCKLFLVRVIKVLNATN